MSVRDRAKLLRSIAEGGYSPYDDEDGSTAHELEQWAKELEASPSVPTMWEIVTLAIAFVASPLLWPYKQARRWRARLRLRRKMRRLGMLLVLVLGTIVPNVGTAQSPDTLLTTMLVRMKIGDWRKDVPQAFCVVFHAEKPERPHLLMLVDVEPINPSDRPLCPDPKGGWFPVLVDRPTCPPDSEVTVAFHEWIMIRCGPNDFARYRRQPQERRAQ